MTPPTGTVTFLFTDIEGSTALWERDRDAMAEALQAHDVLLRSAIEAHAGHVFKTIGDAFCATFAEPESGLRAALEAQRSLNTADWSMLGEAGPLRSRMAVHTGTAETRGGDYFGPHVNRVARIEAAGHGGQVLVSQTTQLLVRGQLPPGSELVDWGEHRLKDLRHSEHIYQLTGPDLPRVDTPPTTAEALHPRDRVRVVGDDDKIDRPAADSPWSLLEAAVVSDEGEAVVLTPVEAQALARHKPADFHEYRLGRIAEWSQPRYRLDGRFVGLSLLIDQGEEAVQGRWQAKEEQYQNLGELLDGTDHPAVVVLGPPGGGKSTLLRRLELDTAIRELRGEGENRVTFFVSLNTYKPARPGDPPPAPAEWLAKRWASRAPDLPVLDDLLAEGRVTLLLDAMNEMPAVGESEFHERVRLWKDWLVHLSSEHSGNRVVFSCRSLDYSQSLSTPDLRVPQVRIEPLTDGQVEDFLSLYSPGHRHEIWSALEGSPQLEVLRSPYFLALLIEQVEATGEMPAGRAGLFTSFVRQALRREVERGGELFKPGDLLASRDLKRIAKWRWKGAYDLPDRGALVPKLASLAHAMQSDRADGERSQVRIDVDDALYLLDSEADEAILAAGEALAVLDEDEATGELMYIHQLVQEYFAARQLASEPDPELVRVEWRAAEIRPSVDEVIDGLNAADQLLGPPQTGWEETTFLAAAMVKDPDGFVRGVSETNLALAGRCAAQTDVRARLDTETLDELRWALVERSRDQEADLRDRIACGFAVGDLGDPRFEQRTGPHGEYLLPPLMEIPGGTYPIGANESIPWRVQVEWEDEPLSGNYSAHMPRHHVELSRFRIGQFPVTNAEWACFIKSGGYREAQWWDTKEGQLWLKGKLSRDGSTVIEIFLMHRERALANPGLLEKMEAEREFANQGTYERWKAWLELDDAAFRSAVEEHLRQESSRNVPANWTEDRYNHPAQPVVGICWYEARAFCRWLSAQTGMAFRLPTEVEFEAAAGGRAGRRFPWGEEEYPSISNTYESGLRRPSPVGVFVESDTPEVVTDLAGNVYTWTSSLFGEPEGEELHQRTFSYPYDARDGREDETASVTALRVTRGGSWGQINKAARIVNREGTEPASALASIGLRLVCDNDVAPIESG